MFDWMNALFAFFCIMALGIFVWMISGIAVWIENKIGFPAGLLAVFVSIAVVFALAAGAGVVVI